MYFGRCLAAILPLNIKIMISHVSCMTVRNIQSCSSRDHVTLMNVSGSRVICQIGSRRCPLMATCVIFLPCNIGVHQGLVIIGPVLYLLFINDIPTSVQQSVINLFGDDTSMYGGEQDLGNLEVLLQNEITNISRCFFYENRFNENTRKICWVKT